MPEHLIVLVMALYSNARSRVGTLAGTLDKFGIGVGVLRSRVSTEFLDICGGNAGGNQRGNGLVVCQPHDNR